MKTFVDEYGVTYSEDRKVLIKGNENLEEYTVLEGTEVIGEDSWGKMSKLKKIVLPCGLHEIGRLAFSGCTGLAELQIPPTVREIGAYAFEFTMLRAVDIPEGVKVLDNDVFNGCFLLEYVMLPSTLERIEDYAFCSCQSARILLAAYERKLGYIAENAIDCNSFFLVPFELQKEYMEAFESFSERFFGVKFVPESRKFEVYSPDGEILGEVAVQVSQE